MSTVRLSIRGIVVAKFRLFPRCGSSRAATDWPEVSVGEMQTGQIAIRGNDCRPTESLHSARTWFRVRTRGRRSSDNDPTPTKKTQQQAPKMNVAVEHDLRYASLLAAANSTTKVSSLTHSFYRYPARFGETFVREVVLNFSREGDAVLDPFCGGGTTLVEALSLGRIALGSDLSELAIFVARAKATPLSRAQLCTVEDWIADVTWPINELVMWHPDAGDPRLAGVPPQPARLIASLRERIRRLPRGACRQFATCLLLKTAQWAFDGKEHLPTSSQIVARFKDAFLEMRDGMSAYVDQLCIAGVSKSEVRLRLRLNVAAAQSLSVGAFGLNRPTVALVVTSPPYLGVHVLYNRWQLQGRRELHAPFFITDCKDLGVASRYTIIPRGSSSVNTYFETIASSFRAVRNLLDERGYVVQLVSFAQADVSLHRYLTALRDAGLELCETYLRSYGELSWRTVPGRRWYARVGAVSDSSAAQEVLLVHRRGR
jgi:DNA modification methylase